MITGIDVDKIKEKAKEKLVGYDVYLANSTLLMPLESEKNPKIVIMCPNEQAMKDVDEILQALSKGQLCKTCGGSGRAVSTSEKIYPRAGTKLCPACKGTGQAPARRGRSQQADEEYKEIPLTQGKVALVDPEDYERLNQFKWRAKKDAHTFYAVRQEGAYPRKFFYMHREILNPPDGCSSDHINGDGLDNRRRNLRICTASQNQHNQKINEQRGSSKYKGVCWHKAIEKFAAYIKANKRLIHLGYFQNEIEAAKAYDVKAIELFGEFAKLNFPNNRQSSTIKIEELVKELREIAWAFEGHFDRPKTKQLKIETDMSVFLNKVADLLTAQAKRCEQLEGEKKRLKELLQRVDCFIWDGDHEEIDAARQDIEQELRENEDE